MTAILCIIIIILLIPHLLNYTQCGKRLKKRLAKSYHHGGNTSAKEGHTKLEQEKLGDYECTIATLRQEKEIAGRELIMLRQRYDALTIRCQQLEKNILNLQNGKPSKSDQSTTMAPAEVTSSLKGTSLRPSVCYAFAASSVSPCGFLESDFAAQQDNRPFVVKFTDSNKAVLSLQTTDLAAMNMLIQSLSYYDSLINFTNNADGKLTSARITSNGELILQSDVWVVKKKIDMVLC